MKAEYRCEVCGQTIKFEAEDGFNFRAEEFIKAVESESKKHRDCSIARINALKMEAAGY